MYIFITCHVALKKEIKYVYNLQGTLTLSKFKDLS